MANYFKAPDADAALLNQVLSQHHQRLEEHGVSVALLVAITEEGPALKVHGYPALAETRVLNQKLRAHGLADAEITLDHTGWEGLAHNEKLALLDHELTHLEIVFDDNLRPKLDDGGRPKLKMRLHDFQFGWFAEVAERHGENSQERKQAAELVAVGGQIFFDFAGKRKGK